MNKHEQALRAERAVSTAAQYGLLDQGAADALHDAALILAEVRLAARWAKDAISKGNYDGGVRDNIVSRLMHSIVLDSTFIKEGA
jgi:hypothetical protein